MRYPRISQFFPILCSAILLMAGKPASAQEDIGFRASSEYDTDGENFADETISELLTTLDGLLAQPEVSKDFVSGSRIHFWRFFNRLGMGSVTDAQTDRIAAHLEGLKKGRDEEVAALLDRQVFQLRHLLIGRKAPDIVGRDMDGEEFSLSDYRGNIVVLFFTGHWCGPCRGEYPYQRLLLEVMADEPVVLLGVNSDADREEAKKAKEEEGLHYRMWWAGWDLEEGQSPTSGRIPTEWNVVGWPTIYIIDPDGVIRYKDKRQEAFITAVRDLLSGMKYGPGG